MLSESSDDSTAPPDILIRYLGGSGQTPQMTLDDGIELYLDAGAEIYQGGTDIAHSHDWVFELAATGTVTKYVDDLPDDHTFVRMIPLGELERYVTKHYHLPGVDDGSGGLFGGTGMALEWIERLVLYTIDLEKRIAHLEAA